MILSVLCQNSSHKTGKIIFHVIYLINQMKGSKYMITTNKNDFIAYFQIINQLNAKSVLDIGMFLKSAGCVSRQACGLEIPGHVILDGIDLFPSIHIPVYEKIYNHIFGRELHHSLYLHQHSKYSFC